MLPVLLSDIVRRVEAEQLATDPSERRMTSRLFNYWSALRDYNPYPTRSAIRFEAARNQLSPSRPARSCGAAWIAGSAPN